MATVETLAAPKKSNQCKEINTPFKIHTFKTEDETRNDFFEAAKIKANPAAAMRQRKKTMVRAFACVAFPKMAVNAYKITIKWILK
jgi:hypothetical protein